jgi:4-amino-4-deoxy-L-arabinose transferase-like glycosyltransferase
MDMSQPIASGPRSAAHSLLVATILLGVGQAFLLLLTPLSRAAAPLGGSAGIALLAADSDLYLSRSVTSADVRAMPWTRWAYLGLLHLGHLLGDAAALAVLANAIAFIVAGALLHDIGRRTASEVSGVVGASVLLLNPMTSQWVRFVLTESLMYSLVVVMLWSAWRLAERPDTSRAWPLLLAATVGTFLRPNGLLLLGSALTLLILGAARIRRRRTLLLATWTGVVLGLGAALVATGQPAEDSFAGQLYGGVVVEGAAHVRVVMAMPEPNDVTDASEAAAVRYGLSHPVATGRLVVTRIAVETSQIRRHYPPVVNIAFGGAMVLLLAAAAIGWRHPGALHLRRPVIVLGLPSMVLVGLTFAVPEGRYGWTYLVLLAPLAGLGVSRLIDGVTAR